MYIVPGVDVNFITNGQANGDFAEEFLKGAGGYFDPGYWRPYIDHNGQRVVTVRNGMQLDEKTKKMVPRYEKRLVRDVLNSGISNPALMNATTLRKDQWIKLDQAIIPAFRQRLKAWEDLESRSKVTFDGYSKMLVEHETMSDPGFAHVDFDLLSQADTDRPKFQLEATPLPFTHSRFWFSAREVAISQSAGGTPLPTAMAEAAGRRIGESLEKTLIGVQTGPTYGTAADYGRAPTVYGYKNFPSRITKTNMTAPTGSNGTAVLSSWLAMRELMYTNMQYGPFMVYTSSDYDLYLDDLFSTTEPSAGTLRERLLKIDGISSIKRLDYLTGTFQTLWIDMSNSGARPEILSGMELTTMMWEAQGGAKLEFIVACIKVPRLKADFNGKCPIGHGTTA